VGASDPHLWLLFIKRKQYDPLSSDETCSSVLI
jgi:hypothetical protein